MVRQSRIDNPLMPLRLFRSRNVSGANAVQALLVVGMFGMFFLGALYLQQVLGYDALEVGLAFLPSTIVMGAMSLRYSGPLAERFGMRRTVLASIGFIGAGMLLFARTPVDGSYFADVLPAMVLVGLGAGLGFPGLMTFAMSGVSPQDAGMASGLVNTSVQVGGAIGLAVLATLASERTGALAAVGPRPRRGAQQRLPPRLPHRRRRPRRCRDRGAGHAPRAEGCPGPGRGPQAGPAPQQPSGLLRGLTRMATDPEIRELSPQPAVTEVAVTDADGIPSVVDAAFPRLFGRLAELGVEPAGPPFIRYLRTGAELELELGIPVGPDAGQSSGLPGGRAAVLRPCGSVFRPARRVCSAAGVGGRAGGRAVLGVVRDEPS